MVLTIEKLVQMQGEIASKWPCEDKRSPMYAATCEAYAWLACKTAEYIMTTYAGKIQNLDLKWQETGNFHMVINGVPYHREERETDATGQPNSVASMQQALFVLGSCVPTALPSVAEFLSQRIPMPITSADMARSLVAQVRPLIRSKLDGMAEQVKSSTPSAHIS